MIRGGRQSAVRAGAQRRLSLMIDFGFVGDVVERANAGIAGIVIAVLPARESARGVHLARNVDDACRSEVGPRELLLARPDQLHRFPGKLGEPRGFDGGFAGMLAAVTRTGVRYDHAHAILWNA